MPAPTQLSPAELAQLEHAFATDPNSDAYRPLAEAYLGMGRFMEAMVVCKKGVKAHPELADARVLLARVYAEQNKDRKALEELEGAIQAVPNSVTALRMAAGLLLKVGENDKGKDYALRALKADPKDAETLELLEKWKIEAPKEAPPPAPAPVAPQVVTAPSASELADAAGISAVPGQQQNGAVHGSRPVAPAGPPPGYNGAVAQQPATPRGPQQIPAGFGEPARPQASRPANRPAPRAPQRPSYDLSQFEEPEEPVRKSGSQGVVFLATAVLAVIALGGWYAFKVHKAHQSADIQAALHDAADALNRDNFASYKRACEAAERILKIDPDSINAQSYLAYAYAIRWGEHGEGETAHQQAVDHLEKAKKLKLDHSHLIAASALVTFFDHQADKAESDLQKQVDTLEEQHRASALVYETLGIIEMRNGDLEKASAHLKKALELAPGEPRIHAAIGDLYRRQGQELLAWTYYDNALRYEKDHADAVLGKTLLVLEAAHPDYKIAEDLIKRVRDSEPPPSPRQLAMAYVLDGMRLNQLGKNADGVGQEQKGLSLDPSNPEIHVLVGRRMLHDGQAAAGLEEIKKAISLDERRASFYVELARAQMATPNGAKDAVASLNKAIAKLPGSAKLQSMLGDAYAKSGDASNAKASYEKALTIDPKAPQPDTRLALAELARKSKDFGRATELYEKAANEFGTNALKVAETLTDEAIMFEEKGEPQDKVLGLYTKAMGADANYAPTYYFVARYLSPNKKAKDKVREAAANYVKLDPKGPYAADAQRLASGR